MKPDVSIRPKAGIVNDREVFTIEFVEWAKEIELRPGLKMILTDYTFPHHHTFDFDITIAPLIFCFILFRNGQLFNLSWISKG